MTTEEIKSPTDRATTNKFEGKLTRKRHWQKLGMNGSKLTSSPKRQISTWIFNAITHKDRYNIKSRIFMYQLVQLIIFKIQNIIQNIQSSSIYKVTKNILYFYFRICLNYCKIKSIWKLHCKAHWSTTNRFWWIIQNNNWIW